VRAFFLFLFLAGCAAQPPIVVHIETPAVIAPDEVAEDAAVPEAKRKKPVKATPAPAPIEVKPLPPCESAPGDKKTAILQKLECLKQTADIPVVKPKP
jgi:hypothetical protein